MQNMRKIACAFLLFYYALSNAITPFIDEIETLLDKPFFEMIDEIHKNDLESEIMRHATTAKTEGGFNDKDRIIGLTALGEYYIGMRDLPLARYCIDKIDFHASSFSKLKTTQQARFHQAKGYTLGYINSHKHSSKRAIQKGLHHFTLAEKLFNDAPNQSEELFRVHFNKARHYLWLDDTVAASREIALAESLLPSVRQDGYKSAYYYIRANIHLAKNDYQTAQTDLKKSRFFMNDLFKNQHLPEWIDEKLANIKSQENHKG